jgi:hypothetical protein
MAVVVARWQHSQLQTSKGGGGGRVGKAMIIMGDNSGGVGDCNNC